MRVLKQDAIRHDKARIFKNQEKKLIAKENDAV